MNVKTLLPVILLIVFSSLLHSQPNHLSSTQLLPTNPPALKASQTGGFYRNWVVNKGSNSSPGIQKGQIVKRDNNGNLVVASLVSAAPFGTGMMVTKFDNSGQKLWDAVFTGDQPGNTEVVDLDIDANGDIYITGTAYVSGTFYDIATVKFTSDGNKSWHRYYNGSLSGNDESSAIAVVGNYVYVTGWIAGTDYTADLVAIKYDLQGNLVWDYVNDGGTDGWIYGKDILADASGNVFVATTIYGQTTDYDLSLLKLDNTGTMKWLSRYDSLGNFEEAYQLKATANGDFIVCGDAHLDNIYQYLIVTFNAQGKVQWSGYNYGYFSVTPIMPKIDLDANNNIYMIGGQRQSFNTYIKLFKYNSSGKLQWDNTFNSGNSDGDEPLDIVVDNNNDVLIAGYQIRDIGGGGLYPEALVLKYSDQGNLLWSAYPDSISDYDSRAKSITVDPSGNIYLIAVNQYGSQPLTLASMQSNGNNKWAVTFNGPAGSRDEAWILRVDQEGNSIIAGRSSGASASYDILVTKYDEFGQVKWIKRIGEPSDSTYWVGDIAVDADNNIYVAASFGTDAGTMAHDVFLIKLAPDGSVLWKKRYDNTDRDIPIALALDNEGNIYLLANSRMILNYSAKMMLLKYAPDGQLIWGNTNIGDEAVRMVISKNNTVYIASNYLVPNTFQTDICITKVSAAGDSVLSFTYDLGDSEDDVVRDLLINEEDNLLVAGDSKNAAGDHITVLLKYDTTGQQIWLRDIDTLGLDSYGSIPWVLDMDSAENIYMAGVYFISNYNSNIYLAKYDKDGNVIWFTTYSNLDRTVADDRIGDMVVKKDGTAYISSGFQYVLPYYSLQNIKFLADGKLDTIDRYQLLTSTSETRTTPVGIALTPNGDVMVACSTEGVNWEVFTLMKYSETKPTGVENPTRLTWHNSQAHPNPFTNQTYITFTLENKGKVRLEIFDFTGKLIRSENREFGNAGEHTIPFSGADLPAGTYIYRIDAGDQMETGKMILIK